MDKDLQARQEARELTRQAEVAQKLLTRMNQTQLDKIVQAIAEAFYKHSGELADMAVRETGFGNVEDKITKNKFASETVWSAIRDMKTVGVLKGGSGEKLWEIGVPVGVIAAIVPSTNPTSTVCYKAMIALKAGNTIVFSPHPKALQCTLRAVRIVTVVTLQNIYSTPCSSSDFSRTRAEANTSSAAVRCLATKVWSIWRHREQCMCSARSSRTMSLCISATPTML